MMNRYEYEQDLLKRQREHLERVRGKQDTNWRPCLHDSCPNCLGTGIGKNGQMCVHGISCPCPKCSPMC